MIYLFGKNPSEVASATADVHLNLGIQSCAKILSAAIQKQMSKDIVTTVLGGVKKHKILLGGGQAIEFMPPGVGPLEPWVEWARMEYNRAWWLTTLSWFFNKERSFRFEILTDHPIYLKINSWAQSGIYQKAFPKRNLKDWDFPLVVPKKTYPLLTTEETFEVYKETYRGGVGKARMKWTGRERPEWMSTKIAVVDEKNRCGLCTSDVPDSRLCPEDNCPRRKMYNL